MFIVFTSELKVIFPGSYTKTPVKKGPEFQFNLDYWIKWGMSNLSINYE